MVLRTLSNNSEPLQIGDKVLITAPAHIAGKIGFVYSREELPNEQFSERWLIQIDSEDIVVSLQRHEFEKIII